MGEWTHPEWHQHGPGLHPKTCNSCRIARQALWGMLLILFVGVPAVAFQAYMIYLYWQAVR